MSSIRLSRGYACFAGKITSSAPLRSMDTASQQNRVGKQRFRADIFADLEKTCDKRPGMVYTDRNNCRFRRQRETETGTMLETERLILRRWEESDAEDLYRYARDPDVGPIAGWPPHRNARESLDVIRTVLSGEETYAVCLKTDGRPIGSVALKLNGHTDLTRRGDECELGFWLGKAFWGQGIIPEAVRELLRHAFEEIGMQKVWCGYYAGNARSKRVQEKVGFRYQRTAEDVDVPLMHEKRTEHVNLMTRDRWERLK